MFANLLENPPLLIMHICLPRSSIWDTKSMSMSQLLFAFRCIYISCAIASGIFKWISFPQVHKIPSVPVKYPSSMTMLLYEAT